MEVDKKLRNRVRNRHGTIVKAFSMHEFQEQKILYPRTNGLQRFVVDGQTYTVNENKNKYRKYSVFDQDDYACQGCGWRALIAFLVLAKGGGCFLQFATGKKKILTVDHIIPKAHGGSNRPNNLETLCECCNGRKSNLSGEKTIRVRAPQSYKSSMKSLLITEQGNVFYDAANTAYAILRKTFLYPPRVTINVNVREFQRLEKMVK